jgi:hypothetical protein
MSTKRKADRNLRHRSTPGPCVTAVVSLATTLIFALSRLAGTTTVNANSASQSDVAAAIASAADGDTVTIPGGTASWTRTLQVTKGITIQGAGVGVTIIKDTVQSGQLILWTLAANYPSRISGIEFQDGGRINPMGAPPGILHVDGSNTNGSTFRFDHCKWNNLNGVTVFDTVIGVIDHNTFVLDKYGAAIIPYGSRWNGQNFGDGSWTAATGFGSSQFLFIEDNTFTHSQPYQRAVTDAYGGARFVIRHNSIFNSNVANHGTESTTRPRGCRAMEIYSNTFTGTNLNKFIGGARSGVVLFHDNSISGYWGDSAIFALQNYRSFHPFRPWGGADGVNTWDANEPNAFFTGTAAANSSCNWPACTVTVSGSPNWSTNQWAGYTIRRTTDACSSGTIAFSWIMSNTPNTISYFTNGLYPRESNTSFCAGDSLEIRKVGHALDQPGAGRITAAVGPGWTPTPPPRGWNNQAIEPCYSWNNINELGHHVNFDPSNGIRPEFYRNDTPMPGYTPYVYPHPLTKGLPSPAQTTRNATANSQYDAHKKRQPWGGKKPEGKKGKKAKKAKESPTNEMPEGQDNPGN